VHQPYETRPLLAKHIGHGNVFAGEAKMRMNAVALFLNLFVPWGVACLCCGVCAFKLMYKSPVVAWGIIVTIAILWVILAVRAFLARNGWRTESKYYDPDPTWLTYLCLAMLIAVVAGVLKGLGIFRQFTNPYLSLQSMKVAGMDGDGIDVGKGGQAIMDAGIVRFLPSTSIDLAHTSHFMYKTLYCVAPLVKNGTVPEAQSYDVWFVGKDCCSTATSDYRCGKWQDPAAMFGTRVTADQDIAFYRLAVQQAESVYGIMARHPVFFTQSINPFGSGYSAGFGGVGGSGYSHTTSDGKTRANPHDQGKTDDGSGGMAGLNRESRRQFAMFAAFMFVFYLFGLTCAVAKFSWLGRHNNPYAGFDMNDPAWRAASGIDSEHSRMPFVPQ